MASRSLGVLTLDLVARVGGFVAGMTQAERAADSRLRAIEKRATAFAKTLGNILGLSFSAALGAGVVAIDKAIDRMDALRDSSIRLGIGVETLSAFDFAAQQTGTSIEDLGKAFKILAKNVADAGKEGSGKDNVFDAIGVATKDAQGNLRQIEDLIPDIADAFKQLEDGTTKAALAQELFGKSGLELVEFLNQGGDGIRALTEEARELGLVFDQEAADKADKFNDELAAMRGQLLGLSTEVAIELLPVLIDLVQEFREWIDEAGGAKVVADELRGVLSGLAETASFLWNVFDTGAMTLKGVAYDLAAVYKLLEAGNKARLFDLAGAKESFEEAKSLSDTAAEASRQIGNNWTEFEREFGKTAKAAKAAAESFKVVVPGVGGDTSNWRIPGLQDSFSAVPLTVQPSVDRSALERALAGITDKPKSGGKKSGKSDEEKALEDLAKAAAAAKEDVDRLNASYAEQIALFGETSEAAKLRYQFEQEDISKLDAATQAYILKQREIAIANAELLDQKRAEKEVQDELNRVNEQRQKAAEQVLADIEAQRALLGATAEAQDTYNKLQYAGVASNSALGQAITEANKSLHEQAKAVADQIEIMDTVRDAAEDVLVGLVDAARSGADAWDILKDAIDNVAMQLTRMIANKLIERALGESGSTSGGSAGGWLEKAAGWLFSAWGSSGGTNTAVGPRAIGGMAEANSIYRINENGPEMLSFGGRDYLMMGAQAGFVHAPDRGQRNITRAFTQVVNLHVQGAPNRSTQKQLTRATGAGARREIGRTGNF